MWLAAQNEIILGKKIIRPFTKAVALLNITAAAAISLTLFILGLFS